MDVTGLGAAIEAAKLFFELLDGLTDLSFLISNDHKRHTEKRCERVVKGLETEKQQ